MLDVDGSRERACSDDWWTEDGARLAVRGGGVIAPAMVRPCRFDPQPSSSSISLPTAPPVADSFEDSDGDGGWTLSRDPLPGEPCSCTAFSSSNVNAWAIADMRRGREREAGSTGWRDGATSSASLTHNLRDGQ